MSSRYRHHRTARRISIVPVKCSNETSALVFNFPLQNGQVFNGASPLVGATNVQGMRKLKHFTISVFVTSDSATNSDLPLFWALVYVPEGMRPNPLNTADGALSQNAISMYESNQHVIATGIAYRYQSSIVRTVTGRNLNSGDAIYFVVRSTFPGTADFHPIYHVAIRLNFAVIY
jgi:hypothetical protein